MLLQSEKQVPGATVKQSISKVNYRLNIWRTWLWALRATWASVAMKYSVFSIHIGLNIGSVSVILFSILYSVIDVSIEVHIVLLWC